MEELRKFQSSAFDTLARRKLIEDQNTIMELSSTVQELQNEVNCMNDSKDVQDAEPVRSGNSHVTSRPVSFPHHKKLEPDCHRLTTMVKRSIEQEIRNKNFVSRNGNFETKRRGQESGDKTACTKNSWRLLGIGKPTGSV